MVIPHEEHSELQVYDESFDTNYYGSAPVFYCMDHELFILSRGLATYDIVEHTPSVPYRKEVYAPVDSWIEYRNMWIHHSGI